MTHSGDSAHSWHFISVPPLTIIRVETLEEVRNAPTGPRIILGMPEHVAEGLGLCCDNTCNNAATWEDALWDADAPIDENGEVVDCKHPVHRIRQLETWCRCDVCHAWSYFRWGDCMLCGRLRLPPNLGEPNCCDLEVPPELIFTSDWRDVSDKRSFCDGA